MLYEIKIALRYLLRAKSHRGFVSFFTFISIACVFIGVLALIVVLSVMTGFEHELKSKVIGMYAHVTITGTGRPIHDWREPAAVAEQMPAVLGTAPYITGPVLLGSLQRGRLLYVLATEPEWEKNVSQYHDFVTSGSPDISEDEIILGDQVAQKMNIRIGDTVKLTSSATIRTPEGRVPVHREFTVAGLFHTGNYEYDSNFGYIRLAAGQHLFLLDDAVHAVKVRLSDMDLALQTQTALQQELGTGYTVLTWIDQNRNLFAAIQMEKRVMFIILSLISVVAALNIISTLVMVVLEKTKDIGILRSLGATTWSVGAVFTLQGMCIALFGVIIGVIFGVLIAQNVNGIVRFVERYTGREFFPSSVYYFDKIPSIIVPADIFIVSLCAAGLCFIASLFPALLAARQDPVRALRYE